MFCKSEHRLGQKNEDRLVQGLPVTSAGQTEKQGAEQGAQRFMLFPSLAQDRNSPSTKSAPSQ